jgi:DNA-directed RNA polymerase specialized sigma24 family protein
LSISAGPSRVAGRCSRRPEEVESATPPDVEAFYLSYFLPLVRRAIRRHGVSTEDANDIVQEAFVLAISKMDVSKNPRAWLYQVVDHLSANFQRKVARRARLTTTWMSTRKPNSRVELGDDY